MTRWQIRILKDYNKDVETLSYNFLKRHRGLAIQFNIIAEPHIHK